jgi:hypothetical protein
VVIRPADPPHVTLGRVGNHKMEPIYFSPHPCYYFNNQYTWQIRETCPFPKVSREEAPAAASAPTTKKWIPLASLYRACKVHVLTSLPVDKARFPEV